MRSIRKENRFPEEGEKASAYKYTKIKPELDEHM